MENSFTGPLPTELGNLDALTALCVRRPLTRADGVWGSSVDRLMDAGRVQMARRAGQRGRCARSAAKGAFSQLPNPGAAMVWTSTALTAVGAAVQTGLQQRGAVRPGVESEQRGDVLWQPRRFNQQLWRHRLGHNLSDSQPHFGSHLADRVAHHLAHDHAESLGEQQRLSSLHRVSVHLHRSVRAPLRPVTCPPRS
jgi:hypothetical protein